MLRFLSGQSKDRHKAQIAVIIVAIGAIALVFLGVTLNLGRMSQKKVTVTRAANLAAAHLGSNVVSYASQYMHVYLNGKLVKCGLTGVLSMIIGFIIAVILTIVSFGTLAPVVIVGLLALASIVMEATYVNSTTTRMFNDQMKGVLTDDQRFMEQAIQTAFVNAVSDNLQIPDELDIDGDQRFMGALRGDDTTGRFVYLYQKRMHDIAPGGYVAALQYIARVEEFLYEGSDGWGLIDKPGIRCDYSIGDSFVAGGGVPAECNKCCVPETVTVNNADGTSDTYDMMPKSCKPSSDPNNIPMDVTSATCPGSTPYPGYPYVFDKSYMDYWNPYRGFLEKIGRDDESEMYNRRFDQAVLDENPDDDPNHDANGDGDLDNDTGDGIIDRKGHPDQIPQEGLGLYTAPTKYYFGDADGNYIAGNATTDDMRTGVFPFFWEAKHFGVDLNTLTKTDRMYPECVWCDPADPQNVFTDANNKVDSDHDWDPTNDHDNGSKCSPCYPDMVVLRDDGSRVDQLYLGQMEDIEYSDIAPGYLVDIEREKNYYVDGTKDNVSGEPPVAPDKISETVQTYVDLMGPANDIWREGAPFYCAGTWPYNYPCYYQYDQMDEMDWIRYGLKEYVNWAILLVNNPEVSAQHFQDSSNWNGELVQWRQRLQHVSSRIGFVLDKLREWKKQTYKSNDAWCIPENTQNPPATSPPPSGESATFGEGKIEDVAACLEWNSDPDVGGLGGNAERFKQCLEACTADACTDLPRSLVPNFNPNVNASTFDNDCNPDTSDWAKNMVKSIAEAEKQAIKMKMRAKFLRSVIARRDKLIDILAEGKANIDAFLLIPDPTYHIDDNRSAVYGWQEDTNLLPKGEGLWHFVRVDVSLPKRLPWLKTYTKGFLGITRCFELADDEGQATVRVTRFDQPYEKKDEGKVTVNFGGGNFLWKFFTKRPWSPEVDLTHIVDLKNGPCSGNKAFYADGTTPVKGAFIASGDSTCAAALQPALDEGVTATTCIQYGRQEAINNGQIAHKRGYAFKFGCK